MPPSPGHFCANSVTAAPCGQKKQAIASSQSQRVTGPDEEMAGIKFKLATATTKSNTRSRRPKTRSSPGFLAPGSGRMAPPLNRSGKREQRAFGVAQHLMEKNSQKFAALLQQR